MTGVATARAAGASFLGAFLIVTTVACGSQSDQTVNNWHAGSPIHTGDFPVGLVASPGGEGVTVVNHDQTVVRVDDAGTVTTLATGPNGPFAPPLAFDSLWLVDPGAGGTDGSATTPSTVARIDPATGAVQAHIAADAGMMVASPKAVWAATGPGSHTAQVWRLDPDSNKATALTEPLGGLPAGLAYGHDRVWVPLNCPTSTCAEDATRLASIDPETGHVEQLDTSIPTDLVIADVVSTPDGIALTGIHPGSDNVMTGTLLLLDKDGSIARSVDLGFLGGGMVSTADGLWISSCDQGTIALRDAESGKPIGAPVTVGAAETRTESGGTSGSCPNAITLSGDTLWVANINDDAVVPVRATSR